jgi:tetratricopeptide (TPR) repeat protein
MKDKTLADVLLTNLENDLKKHLGSLQKALEDKEKWLDANEETLDEKAHEEAVRQLDQYESLLECLEEALDVLGGD